MRKVITVTTALVAVIVVVFAVVPAAAQTGVCRQAELLAQEYFAARGEYSSTRSGWNRVWETGRDAGLGALVARGTTRNWRTIAQVAGYVGAGSVVLHEITNWRNRKGLDRLRADMLAAQAACDRQEREERTHLQARAQEEGLREELRGLREEMGRLRQQPQPQLTPSAPPALPLPTARPTLTVENCFKRTIVAVRLDSGDKILHPGQKAEVAGQPELWSWTGSEWVSLEQKFVHSVSGGWQIY